jgi:tetratricopeptide (TPR) repeat protein
MRFTRYFFAALFCLVIFLTASTALAQEKSAQDIEKEALKAEAKGLYADSCKLYREAFLKCVDDAQKAEDKSRAWSFAEVYLDRMIEVSEKVSAPDYSGTVSVLEEFEKKELAPILRARLKWYLAEEKLHLGKIDESRSICKELGFVTDWMVIGPFDNERGASFGFAYGPENETDFTASYDGKKREVGWRRLPVSPVLGLVDMDAMMRPNDEVLAYAAAFVHSKTKQDAALRVASDEGVKIWVNDQLIADLDIHRNCTFDQNSYAVVLHEGANKILVKLAERNGQWRFGLRLTNPEGGPLSGITFAETAKDFAEAKYEKAPVTEILPIVPASFKVNRGAIDYFTEAVSANSENKEAQFQLAYIHLLRGFEDENVHKDREGFRKCADLDAANAGYRYFLSRAYEERVQMAAEKEENNRRQALEEALKLDPTYVEANLALATYYLHGMHNKKKAKEYLDAALAANPDFLPGILLGIEILSEKGFDLEPELKYLELAKSEKEEFRSSPEVLSQVALHYKGKKQVEKVIETYNRILQIDYDHFAARRELIDQFKELGRFEDALAEYEKIVQIYPYSTDALCARAQIYKGLDRFSDAIGELDRALTICPEDEETIVEEGKLLLRLSQEKGEKGTGEIYDKGKKCLESALRINPNNVWLRRYLEFMDKEKKSYEDDPRLAASIEVKEGSIIVRGKKLKTENGKPVTENGNPVLEDYSLSFDAKTIDDDAKKENLPYICLLSDRITKINRDGTSSDFYRIVLRLTNDEGTQIFREGFPIRESYGRRTRIKFAQVLHEDGTKEEADVSGSSISFPPLKVSDVLAVEARYDDQTTDLTERFFGDYYGDRFFFHFLIGGDVMPLKLCRFTLILPKEREFFFNSKSIKPELREEPGIDEKTTVRVYEVKDLPRVVLEILPPPYEQFLPCMEISTFGDWKKFGQWFYNLTKKQFDTSPEMKKKVEELTKDAKTQMEKIRAIYNFVISDVRYEQWEFGIHGWQPYKASVIFARKNGDCKDKALLLNSMLSEIGVKGCLVLIEGVSFRAGRGTPDMTLPMIFHFNHCISYVPPSGDVPELWLDGTAEHYAITDAPPFMDWGAVALVVDENGGELKTVALPDPEKYQLSEKATLTLDENENAKVKITVAVHGDTAAVMRQLFSVEGERKTKIENFYGARFGGAKVTSVEFPDLKDLSIQTLTLSYELEIPANFVKKTSEGLALTSTLSPVLVQWSILTPEAERKLDMVLPYLLGLFPLAQVPPVPGTVISDYTYLLPKGFKIESLPQNQDFDSEFASFSLKFDKEEGESPKVFIKRTFTARSPIITTKNYPKMRELTNIMEKAQKENIIIKKIEEEKK